MSERWHDQDRFWEDLGPFLFKPGRREAAKAEAERAAQLLKLEPAAAVLDLCCGPGRHALELARMGFHVTGVDRTAAYLGEARKSAAAEGLPIDLVHEDARTFRRPGRFQGAINLFTSFGYFEDPEDDRRVLSNVHESLQAGGRFLMELMGKEVLARIFLERTWEEAEGRIILEERWISRDWSWIENRWIVLMPDGRRSEHAVSHRLYSAAELSALLRDCGFGDIRFYGNLDGTPYDHKAQRLVLLAEK